MFLQPVAMYNEYSGSRVVKVLETNLLCLGTMPCLSRLVSRGIKNVGLKRTILHSRRAARALQPRSVFRPRSSRRAQEIPFPRQSKRRHFNLVLRFAKEV